VERKLKVTMSWSFKSFADVKSFAESSTKLKVPTFDELRNTVSSSVQAVNSSVQEAYKEVNANVSAGMNSSGSTGLMGKVRQAFELDSLHAAVHQSSMDEADEMHFPELDLTYITDRVIIMGFPAGPRHGNSAKTIAEFLNKRHGNDYMVWNISERKYDTSFYKGQVMEFSFPGYPAPPIGMLFKLVMGMESWLKSDDKNVVVIHCITGRGRSATVAACLLEWVGRAASSRDALSFVCKRRKTTLSQAVVPSQFRYIDMFHEIMDGIRPRYEPLNMKRFRVIGIPDFMSAADKARSDLPSNGGCKPYLQVYKNGKLLFTTEWEDSQKEGGTKVYNYKEDTEIAMDVDCFVDGDILLRLRHIDTTTGRHISMFRYGFHTGYVPMGVLGIPKEELDGASVDPRFAKDFSIEIEFEPTQDKTGKQTTADAMFDATISSKASFWDEIARKKKLARERTPSELDRLLDAPPKKHEPTDASDPTKKQAGSQGAAVGAGATSAAASSSTADGETKAPRPEQVVEFSLLDDEDDDFEENPRKNRLVSSDSTSALFSSLVDPVDAPSNSHTVTEQVRGNSSPSPEVRSNDSVTDDKEVKHEARELRKEDEYSSAKSKMAEDNDEDVDDLAALERDLGIDESEMDDENVSPKKSASKSAEGGNDDDPELAELEQYLEGL